MAAQPPLPESTSENGETLTTSPKVAIVVLNWNGWADTVECLDSLSRLSYAAHTVIVVDNGSTDNSVREIRSRFPDLMLIETGRNLGYAGGNNVGLRHAIESGFDFGLLLNNDTICPQHFIQPLVLGMLARQDAGFAGPIIYFNEERTKVWSAGARWCGVQKKLLLVDQAPPTTQSSPAVEVESLVGCALMVRLAAIARIGLLDEGFFLMHEESDWCARGKKTGLACILVADSSVFHKISVSFGGASSPLMQYFDQRNTLYWAERHLPFLDFVGAAKSELARIWCQLTGNQAAISWHLPRSIARGVYVRWRHAVRTLKQPGTRARLTGYTHYLLRRTGDCPSWVRRLAQKSARV
jgi:GT2 family glycosyltransferase